MVRVPRDFLARSEVEQAWMLENTWCETCQKPDLGMVEPVEYEEAGEVFLEGRCAKCGTPVRSTISTVQATQAGSEPAIPRWVQIIAGVLLLPLTLLCVVGAVSIFGIPKVQGDPLLQLLAGVIVALCLWAVVLAVRMLFGIKGRYGLMGPVSLRIIAVVAVGLVIGAPFSGVYAEHPVRTVILSVSYIFVAIRLWRMASIRSSTAA